MSHELSKYMSGLHREIVRTAKYPYSCGEVALDIAEIFKSQGSSAAPQIVDLRGKTIDGEGNTDWLIPRYFEGGVYWGAHLICADEDDIAYDPVLAKPIALQSYLETMFVEPAEINLIISGSELEDLLASRHLVTQIIYRHRQSASSHY